MEKQAKTRILNFMGLMMAVIFLWSCGGGNQQKQMEEKLAEAKKTCNQNLNELNKDLDERIAYIDEQMETASEDVREDLMAARTQMEEQKTLVAQELKNIEEAGLESWDEVVAETRAMVVKIRQSRNEISLKVRELLGEEE